MRVVLEKNDIVSYESSFDAFSVFHAGSINRTVRASIPVPEFADPNVHTIYIRSHTINSLGLFEMSGAYLFGLSCAQAVVCVYLLIALMHLCASDMLIDPT